MTITDETSVNGTVSSAPRTLGDLLEPTSDKPGEAVALLSSQVVTCDGTDVVLIGATPTTTSTGTFTGTSGRTVEIVSEAGLAFSRERDVTAVPVTDPARRETVLRLALARLALRYREAVNDRNTESREKAELRDKLRSYLIERAEDDDIDREQLRTFLDEFDLPAYQPTYRVSYTLTGSYDVNTDDPTDASSDAEGYLRPDLSRLDNVDGDDCGLYEVSVNEVERIDADG